MSRVQDDRTLVREPVPAMTPGERAAPGGPAAALAFLRRHALFACLLGAGAALRAATLIAYRPALIYYDSVAYLKQQVSLLPDERRPLGYPGFVHGLLNLFGPDLAPIPAIQHLMGLLMAALIYALLVRLRVPRWAAALAAAPVLLDAYQLVIEQYVLSETLFETLIVGGCALLLWRPRPHIAAGAVAGVLFAGAAVTRANGIVVIGPALLATVFLCWRPGRAGLERAASATAGGVRAGLGRMRGVRPALPVAAALVVAFALPVSAYATWYHHLHGTYSITGYGGRFLYARVTPFADCSRFAVPADERPLCPTQPVGHRPTLAGSTVNWYMFAGQGTDTRAGVSPLLRIGRARARKIAGPFAKRVIVHQPLDYLRAVSHDFLRGFAPIRTRGHDELPIFRWQFRKEYPVFSPVTLDIVKQHGDGVPQVSPRLARFLHNYGRAVYLPGPLLALGLVAGLLAALGVGRARRSGLRSASFLFAGTGFVLFLSTVMTNEFTWRYVIPLLVLFPPAAALALTALLRRPT
ncbi:MAG TPA: phospholipid carrier-dependent glycosyltransferase [Solirubrobacteraceae bacterium]